ncbi:MAG: hypothetical protein AAF384_06300 [Pseudomonadota bacterium]
MQASVVQQPEKDGPGWSRLRVEQGLPADLSRVELSIRRNAHPQFLGPSGWQDAEHWLTLEDINRDDSASEITIPPAINHWLVRTTLLIKVRADEGVSGELRLAWPALVLAGAASATAHETAPQPIEAPTESPAAPPEPPLESTVEPQTEPVPAFTAPEPPAEPDPPAQTLAGGDAESAPRDATANAGAAVTFTVDTPTGARGPSVSTPVSEPKRSGTWLWLLLAVLVIGGAVAAYFYWASQRDKDTETDNAEGKKQVTEEPQPPAPTEPKCELEAISAWMKDSTPDAAAIVASADRCSGLGEADIALRLYQNAARQGNADASLKIARWLDPETFKPEGNPFKRANPERAARFYQAPAEAGNLDAQYRLGRLLESGASADPVGVERGVEWIQRAADAGHEAAKAYLKK